MRRRLKFRASWRACSTGQHAMDRAAAYHAEYRRGNVHWTSWPFGPEEPVFGLDYDEFHRPDGCAEGWHPPLALPSDQEFSGRVAALAKRTKLPHHATIMNHMARAF